MNVDDAYNDFRESQTVTDTKSDILSYIKWVNL